MQESSGWVKNDWNVTVNACGTDTLFKVASEEKEGR